MAANSKSKLEKTILSNVKPCLAQARQKVGKSNLRLLLAVSGGMDSSVMLRFLDSISQTESLALVVGHLNHGLRVESVEEEKFVRKLSSSLELEYFTEKAEAFDSQSNLEAWAREKRYEFLEKTRIASNCDLVVTAHHQDDQAETVLMRLLSGRFSTSAKAIASIDLERKIFRPFISCQKSLIEDYAGEFEVDYVEDPSNADLARTRNWLRHKLIPIIESEYNPSAKTTLSILAQRFSDDEAFLSESVAQVLEGIDRTKLTQEIRELPNALRWRVLLRIAEQDLGVDAERLGYHGLKRLSEAIILVDNGALKQIELGGGISCHFRAGGDLSFSKES